jgi:hypothetical protein
MPREGSYMGTLTHEEVADFVKDMRPGERIFCKDLTLRKNSKSFSLHSPYRQPKRMGIREAIKWCWAKRNTISLV